MSHDVNCFEGIIGVSKGETRSLDNSSHRGLVYVVVLFLWTLVTVCSVSW